MKENKYSFLLLVFSLTNLFGQSSLFDGSYMHEIRITSTENNFWQLLDDDYADFLDNDVPIPYHSVTVEVDGNILENVGARQKGYSSNFFTNTTKKPLKLNFGKFVEDQKYDGVKKINLANGLGDPAIIKDKIVYDMFRMHGIPSPRVSHVKVFIQDEYWGVYAIIEQIDKRYLKRNFADKNGNLWKNKGNSDLEWLGTNPNAYSFELQTNEDENDWTKFIEFVDFINNSSNTEFKDGIESIFDLDEYLRILAIDILTNNWDSYIQHGRNWYLYYEPNTNKIHWLPWDYNFAFDRSESGFEDFPIILNDNEKILIKRILEVPEFRIRYLNYLCEILEVNFTEDRLFVKLDTQLDLIDDEWSLATNNIYNLTTVQSSINNSWNGEPINFGVVQGFKKFIEDRTPIVANDISNENHTCIPLELPLNEHDVVINEFMAQNMEGSPWNDQENEHDDWIELFNNTNSDINLTNYFLSDSPSFIHKWEFSENTIIPANGYLIVWADKDPQQGELHTKFNLDKDGDELLLSYIDGTIIDSVDYSEEQEENKSLSRIPNGTGDFIVADVTFSTENTNENLGFYNSSINQGILIYPNPADNILNINFTNKIADKIIIFDLLGREVYNTKNNISILSIDVSNWNTGMYVIKFINNSFNITEKFIVN